ncbi:Ankyrin repeat protein [Pandoravirus kuranda]|uniref:Ankyrin repeat protein n=1 Tax=Pandoravirus kuranda TaxID=3019033 RepID=A0AA95J3Z9_9VIRU|nr:Ankyrin repeat protein [Pandoravirus kuranda]
MEGGSEPKGDGCGLPIPNEITSMILENLDEIDAVAAAWVSREWRQLLASGSRRARHPEARQLTARAYTTALIERGHLDVLQWARENRCPLNREACMYAAVAGGHLGAVEWLRAGGYPLKEDLCHYAAYMGQLGVLQWLRANGCPWNAETCAEAALGGPSTFSNGRAPTGVHGT